ncbi:MAG: hypothetical protein ILM98_14235 [Kiritimatiellae bacterium]|nr:hypothetical protein [Kiritimatiellia bacterium]
MNDSTLNMNVELVKKSIPTLQLATKKGDQTALELLEAYSKIPGEVGTNALLALGELFCDQSLPFADFEKGFERLREAARQGQYCAVKTLIGFLFSNPPKRHLQSSWDIASIRIHQLDFWKPLIETYIANCTAKKEFYSLIVNKELAINCDEAFSGIIKAFFEETEHNLKDYLKFLMDKSSNKEIFTACAKKLCDMACSGDESALILLMSYYKRLDKWGISQLIDKNIISLSEAQRYLALGLKTEIVNEAPWEYYQKGAFLGSVTCKLKIIRLRLTQSQTDLEAVEKSLSEITKTPSEESLIAEVKSLIKLFVIRCNEARAVDEMVIRSCNDIAFKDNETAQSIIFHYNKLSSWIAAYGSKMA